MTASDRDTLVPAWRPIQDREREAIGWFSQHSVVRPLLMRSKIIDLASREVPPMSMEDLLWASCSPVAAVYFHDFLGSGSLKPGYEFAVFCTGLSGIAGNIPELLTDVGFDPFLLSSWAYLGRVPWTPKKAELLSPEENEQIHRLLARAVAETQRALVAFIAWQDNPDHREHVSRVFSAIGSDFIPRESAADWQDRLVRLAKKSGCPEICREPEDALDAFHELFVRMTDGLHHADFGGFCGDDGNWHLNTNGALAAAQVGRRHRKVDADGKQVTIRENVDQHLIESTAQPNAIDPADVAEQRDLARLARQILEAVSRDEIDRQDIELIFEGEANRSRRAEQIGQGCAESKLRYREGRLLQLALRKAPQELREPLKRLLSA